MSNYKLNPYVHFIEDRLNPEQVQHGVVHRLTGEVFRLSPPLQSALLQMHQNPELRLAQATIEQSGPYRTQVEALIARQFLISENVDPLATFLNWLVVRPSQNPAVVYRANLDETVVVHTSMTHFTFSPKPGHLAEVFEEVIPEVAAAIYTRADGAKTLLQITEGLYPVSSEELLSACRTDIDFLTSPERQLIKFAPNSDHLDNPYQPFNSVPRSVSHSDRWDKTSAEVEPVIDFHQQGIADPEWEFNWVEPTVNHAFRFPSEAFGGLNYAARFAETVLGIGTSKSELNVLEIGGGTGSFARGFIEHANSSKPGAVQLNYHILDLSPALIESQKGFLANLTNPVIHFEQDATGFDLPGHEFDLIIANEVIADLPTAPVRLCQSTGSEGQGLEGDGVKDVLKYELAVNDAPDSFLVNSGTFRLLERVWKHLAPGGTAILSEYGGASKYPVELNHLSHVETSIHFGHVQTCAEKLGFQTQLLTLTEFLKIDDEVEVLVGSSEQIHCLNHVLNKFGESLPYAAISRREFEDRFGETVKKAGLVGFTFSPLRKGFHFGPDIRPFMVIILNKPE